LLNQSRAKEAYFHSKLIKPILIKLQQKTTLSKYCKSES